MGKDLTYKHDSENTREVLFEKTQIYYYNHYSKLGQGGGVSLPLEECMLHYGEVMIGSNTCSDCAYNKGFNDDECYIICTKIKEATSNG